jgi:hypothetical protein
VVNAVSLAFIRDIDEMLFFTFVPLSLQDMLRSVKDLRMPVLPKRPTWSAILLIIYCSMIAIYITENHGNMKALLEETCGGDTNFAVSAHQSLDVIFAARTSPYEALRAEEKDEAVKELICAGCPEDSLRSVTKSVVLPSVLMLRTVVSSSASSVADETMTNGCRDIESTTHSVYWEKLREQLQRNGTSCQELESSCEGANHALMRMMCPLTCKCFRNQPVSAVHEGCAYKNCQEGGDANNPATYYDYSVECKDLSADVLANNKNWIRFWDSYVEAATSDRYVTLAGAAGTEAVQEHRDFALSSGCEVVEKFELDSKLCADSPYFQPVASYCPITCGCEEADYWGCPVQCRADW